MGEADPALDLLEKVHPMIPPADQAWTRIDPDLLPLHASPRFQALFASVERSPRSARGEAHT